MGEVFVFRSRRADRTVPGQASLRGVRIPLKSTPQSSRWDISSDESQPGAAHRYEEKGQGESGKGKVASDKGQGASDKWRKNPRAAQRSTLNAQRSTLNAQPSPLNAPSSLNSLYSTASTSAIQLASMMFSLTPTVLQKSEPSSLSMTTRTRAAVPSVELMTRTL